MRLIKNFFKNIRGSSRSRRIMFSILENIENEDVRKTIIEELNKNGEDQTTIQIRLFDDKTGSVTYKHLTRNEFLEILKIMDNTKWLHNKRSENN